jgi:D-alanyl-D-alanine dipeptidase
MTERDEARLRDLHPELAARVARVLVSLEGLGWPMTVTDGRRTTEQQQKLWRQGRTQPGPNVRPGHPLGDTVTGADGVTGQSKHQTGRAVDCAFLDKTSPGKVTWSDGLSVAALRGSRQGVGLVLGRRSWTSHQGSTARGTTAGDRMTTDELIAEMTDLPRSHVPRSR